MYFRRFPSLIQTSNFLISKRFAWHSRNVVSSVTWRGKRNFSQSKTIFEEEKNQKNQPKKFAGPITWSSVGLLFVSGAIALGYFSYLKKKRDEQYQKTVESVGKANIGGPFELIDHTGKKVTNDDYRGKFLFIYFGFTHCPDICPIELQKMAQALNKLGKTADLIQPLFISVDPERDTIEKIAKYVKEFHPKIIGLTGTPEQISKVAKAYRVYYSVTPGTKDQDEYLLDHSIILYLMDPEGNFLKFYGKNETVDSLTKNIQQQIKNYLSR